MTPLFQTMTSQRVKLCDWQQKDLNMMLNHVIYTCVYTVSNLRENVQVQKGEVKMDSEFSFNGGEGEFVLVLPFSLSVGAPVWSGLYILV